MRLMKCARRRVLLKIESDQQFFFSSLELCSSRKEYIADLRPMSCTNCHQFYGSPESNNLCSSCYRKLNPEASQLLNQIRQQKEEYQNHWKELVSQGNIPLLIEYYHGPTPFPVDMMESFVRDYFSSQVRAYNIEICQQLMGHPPFHDIIHRLCPNILSDIINNLRHRYGTPPNSSHLALFDYFLTFNEFKVRLTEKDLETALCIYQGTEIIRRLLDLSKEGVFQLTKASLEAAQYLNKRPNNVPTPEKKNHILMVKAALDEQNHKRKRLLSQNNENENDDKEHDSKVEENEISRSSDGPGTTPGTTTSTTGNSYLHDMIQYGCNDLEIPFNNEAIGMKIYPTSDGNKNERRRQYYTIIEFKKQSGGNSRIIAQKLRNSSEIIELDEDTVMCDWVGDISSKQQTLWSSYQDKIIQEGVWTSRLDGDLRIEFNNLVDEFATIEPIDYHPGTKDIVRDLIHPSLYPLILSTANKPPTKGRAKYDETQRNFFHRPYEISRFQWLPSEVDIDQHGIARFVTPINNLDETKYPQLYDCLGRILTHLIPGFEQVRTLFYEFCVFNDFIDLVLCSNSLIF